MRNSLGIILLVIGLLSSSRCAKRGNITGGAKDSLPPILISAVPPIGKLNFDANKIVLTFDEYIQLKDIANQLVVSPPIDPENYKILPEGTVSKKVIIQFEVPPKDNVTYTFNFGSSIEDYNERNPLPFFDYTFSTGDHLDSLTLSGEIRDAYEAISPTGISIHLYPIDSTYTDSTIFLEKPYYIGNTLDSVIFKLKNLAPGKYEMIALQDVGKNYVFDQNIDKIGFFEQPIELPQDSLKFPIVFKEITNFKWGRPQFVNDHHIIFGYYGEVENRRMNIISEFKDSLNGFYTQDRNKDTLHFWFNPQKEMDSLTFEHQEADSIRTTVVKFIRPELDSLQLSITPGGTLHFNDTLRIESNLPVIKVDKTHIQIFDIDTLEVPFETFTDDFMDRVYLVFDKVPNDNYSVQLMPNAITDFLGATNDTIFHTVSTRKIEDYGILTLTVNRANEDMPYFMELLDQNGKTHTKILQNESNIYRLENLVPGKYQVRIIKDLNGNQRWDTGNYLLKIQAEETFYLEGELDVRANWELNERITIED